MEQYEKALDFLKNAYNSFKKIKGEDDSETQTAYKKMKEIEEILERQLHGDEYAKWKLLMEENRLRAEKEAESEMTQMEEGDKVNEEPEYVAPKIYGPGSVQKSKKSVFEDDFFEL